MADYRGGDRHRTGYGDELVKAIREQRTERQRKRNFEQKLLFTGIQAGLAGVGAAANYANREDGSTGGDRAEWFHDGALASKGAVARAGNVAVDAGLQGASGGTSGLPDWLHNGAGELAPDNSVLKAATTVTGADPYAKDPMVSRAENALLSDTEKPRVTWGANDERPRGRGMMGSQ